MAPAGDQVQLRTRDALHQQVGIGRRVYLVLAAVDDQRGRADVLQRIPGIVCLAGLVMQAPRMRR